ncbi:hypothetical protein CGA21_20930 [Pseudomonas sp. PSB11]|nr:hypothetical protein [Pseudomonas sp. PSB11]
MPRRKPWPRANPWSPAIPLWERACSRIRTDIHHRCRLTHRFREQARSHSDVGGEELLCTDHLTDGSPEPPRCCSACCSGNSPPATTGTSAW